MASLLHHELSGSASWADYPAELCERLTRPMGNADRLIWLFDMYLLAESFAKDDWQRFLALAKDRSICATCKHNLDAAAGFFPLAVPGDMMEKYQTSNRLALPFLYVHRVFAGLKRYF